MKKMGGFEVLLGKVPSKAKMIVLTGGPCAGKTSALAHLVEHLSNLGFTVILAPEAATILKNAGITPPLVPGEVFQRMVLSQILLSESQAFLATHYSDKPVVIIADRGVMDGGAYASTDIFKGILGEFGMTTHTGFGRYQGAFHLRTAAMGAEDFYTTENNTARSETPAEARELDEKTLQAWTGHPHLRVIDNSTDFKQKMHRLTKEVCLLLGVPEPLEIERKYLVDQDNMPNFDYFKYHMVAVDIIQHYLSSPAGMERRVRRRTLDTSHLYFLTTKVRMTGGQSVEREEMISVHRYRELIKEELDPRSKPIRKIRHIFVYNNRVFELDCFHEPQVVAGRWLLEVELNSLDEKPELPPFLKIVGEVTDDPVWKNANIARMK